MQTAALIAHPQSSSVTVSRIEVRIGWSETGELALAYKLQADLTRIRIPPPHKPERADELWRHTCFEAFLGRMEDGGYYEFNFSPSGRWAAYRFRRYRERTDLEEFPAPQIAASRSAESLRLDAKVDLQALAGFNLTKIALAAVVEDNEGALSYWALRHPPGKPDFHHADNFMLELSSANGTER